MNLMPWENIDKLYERVVKSNFMTSCVNSVATVLITIGVPANRTPDADDLMISTAATIGTLAGYWYWLGRSHARRRIELQNDLNKAQRIVRELEEKLIQLKSSEVLENHDEGKEIRIWMDGAFDMMHYGHMNAFRKGRAMGTTLIVGVNSDETITQCKGAPVCNDEERMGCVKGCKFVDEVVTGVPYIMNDEYLKWVIEEYKIDYVVHGDDPCIVDGKDVYESAQKMGKYLTIPRTEGISTTDIVGRMLLTSRSHHSSSFSSSDGESEDVSKQLAVRHVASDNDADFSVGFDRKSDFLTTSHIFRLFGAGNSAPGPDARVVYVAGSWDMFHAGHVALLEKAKMFGDYVIVGVHGDSVVNSRRGMNYPLMNMHERSLSVLGCKYVNDVLLDAPYNITKLMISSLKICAVVRGSNQPEGERWDPVDDQFKPEMSPEQLRPPMYPYQYDPYKLAREMGILHVVPSTYSITAPEIVDRIHLQRQRFKEKFAKKKVQEDQYYENLYGHAVDDNTASASASAPTTA